MKSVLIVDDDPALVELLKAYLEARSGCKVRSAADGKKALDEILNERPDLVITDIYMPEMDGFQLIERLKSMRVSVPVVIISGMYGKEDARRAEELGIRHVLEKPFNFESLNQAVDLALGRSAEAEGRQKPRFPVRLIVQYVVAEKEKKVTYETETVNCSMGGLCLKWYLPFGRIWSQEARQPKGRPSPASPPTLDLTLRDPRDSNRTMKARARIVHCVSMPDKEFDYIGAEFIDLDEQGRQLLGEFLRTSG
jgi:DNA-binding response OmpR family regulator